MSNVTFYGPDTLDPIQTEAEVVARFGAGSREHAWYRWALRGGSPSETALYIVTAHSDAPRPRPTYNHTREDGPFDPCPACLVCMPREDLLRYVWDLRITISDMLEDSRAREE